MKYFFLIFSFCAFSNVSPSMNDEDKLIYKYSSNLELKGKILLDIDQANKSLGVSNEVAKVKEKKKESINNPDIIGYSRAKISTQIVRTKEEVDKEFYLTYLDSNTVEDSREGIVDTELSLNNKISEREIAITHFDGVNTYSIANFIKGESREFKIPLFEKLDFYMNVVDGLSEAESSYLLLKKPKNKSMKIKLNKDAKEIYFNENFKKIDSFKKASYVMFITKYGHLKVQFNVKKNGLRKNYFLREDSVFYDEIKFKRKTYEFKLNKGNHFKVWGDNKKSFKINPRQQRLSRKYEIRGKKQYFSFLKNKKMFKVSTNSKTLSSPNLEFSKEVYKKMETDEKVCIAELNFKNKIDFINYEYWGDEPGRDLEMFSIINKKLHDGIELGARKVYISDFRNYIANLHISYVDGTSDYQRIECDSFLVSENF